VRAGQKGAGLKRNWISPSAVVGHQKILSVIRRCRSWKNSDAKPPRLLIVACHRGVWPYDFGNHTKTILAHCSPSVWLSPNDSFWFAAFNKQPAQNSRFSIADESCNRYIP